MPALCVYGVVGAEQVSPTPPGGIEGRPVFRIESGPLAALVSEAPAGPVKANRRNLMAHSNVLQEVVAEHAVLPMRFGIVMPGAEAVEDELLRQQEQQLVEQLGAFESLVEIDLKVLCKEETLLRSILAERPDIAELREQLRGKSPDATYYERIKLGEQVARATEERRATVLRTVVARLEPLALETEIAETAHEQVMANVAFLVERARLGDCDEAVRKLDEELGADMRLKYVGPLPPYHFVETATGAGSAAWA